MFLLIQRCFLIFLSTLFSFISFSYASDEPIEREGQTPVGEIIFVAGKALVRLVPEADFRTAVPKQKLVSYDMIKTTLGARLSILFKDETQLKLASNTAVIIREVTPIKEKPGALKILLRLESGEVWTRSKSVPEGLMIETPYATAAIRGTEWSISVKENESRVIVMQGNVHLSNPFGSITVGKDEQAVIVGNTAPFKSVIVRPRDRTQWTHYLTEKRLLGYLKFEEGVLPGTPEALFNAGRLEESGSAFKKRISTKPNDPVALTGLGLIELKKGNLDKAEPLLNQALEVKEELLALLGKAYQFISLNNAEGSAEILRNASQSFPEDPLPYIFFSYLHAFHGDFSEALKGCDKGLSALPNNPLLLAFKTDLYLILDKPEDAKTTIDTLLKENPRSSEGYERLGFYYRMVMGNSRKARDALKKSIELDDTNDEAIAKMADLLREEGYISEALKLIEKALSIAPWNALHHYNYGRLLADINKIDKARMEFRKALELDSTFSRAYLGEGIVLLKEGKTEEALKTLSKASLLEPNLSEIHSFLAIAYYQKHEVRAALDELKRAEECDPLDSTPHQLASAIYNNLYMPVEAIEEARKVLELLPYKRASGYALLEGSQNGVMSVNYGMDFLDLAEWSLYYAQKALFINPYRNTSHIGLSKAYDKLGQISSLQGLNEFTSPSMSERLQGLTLNVNSLNFSNRYSTLISKPGHFLTLGGTYGHGDSDETQADLSASGDLGSRFPLTYSFFSKAYRDSGPLTHDESKNGSASIVLGYKPSYDHDLYLNLGYLTDRNEVTPIASKSVSEPDDNQKSRDHFYSFEFGYHKEFSPVSHLMANLRYFKTNGKLENPDLGNDGSGFASEKENGKNIALGIKHLFALSEAHQASYGLDCNFLEWKVGEDWPYVYPEWIYRDQFSLERTSLNFYLFDRWTIKPGITFDAGLFLSYYRADVKLDSQDTLYGSYAIKVDKNTLRLNPRIGLAIDLGQNGILRVGYQKRSIPGFNGELAPIGVSGLIPPTFDIAFNAAEDIQGSIEYELTRKTFVKFLLGYESLSDLTTLGDNKKAQLRYGRFAINQILGRHFSFSARYNYNGSRYLDGSGRQVYGIPRHSGDARLVFIHPSEVYLSLRESYVGEMFADDANRLKLKSYFTTDFYAQKELFQKRVFLSFSICNLFNKSYTAINRNSIWYSGPLPARGRTLYFRGEYRF